MIENICFMFLKGTHKQVSHQWNSKYEIKREGYSFTPVTSIEKFNTVSSEMRMKRTLR